MTATAAAATPAAAGGRRRFVDRPARLFSPPAQLLQRVRWIFLLFALATGVLLLTVTVTGSAAPALRGVGVTSCLGLSGLWIAQYRRSDCSPVWDLTEGVALVVVAIGVGNPLYMLLLLYGRLSFRSLTTSSRRAVLVALVYLAAFLAPMLILRGQGQQLSLQLVFLASGFPLATGVMNVLRQTLERLEQAVERERVLRAAGVALVAAADREATHAPSLTAAAALVGDALHEGAVLALTRPDGSFVIVARNPAREGEDTAAPGRLPVELTTALRDGAAVVRPARDVPDLVAAPGFHRAGSVALAPFFLDHALGGFIAVSLAGRLSDEATSALTAIGAQLGLALDRADLSEELHHRKSEERFRTLVQSPADVIAVIGGDSGIRFVSPSVERILGYDQSRLVGTRLEDLLHPGDGDEQSGNEGDWSSRPAVTESLVRHRDGSWRYMEIATTNLAQYEQVRGVVVKLRDVTERRQLEEDLRRRAFQDPLTHLANRTLFEQRTRNALARAGRSHPTAVLFLDLDGFKAVNDAFGHLAGDRLLVEVAQRLTKCTRPGDLAARFGGDEFGVLIEETDPDDVARVAERIIDVMQAPFAVGDVAAEVSASVGIAFSDGRTADVDELLGNADGAMYRAKSEGKSRYRRHEPVGW